MLMFVALKETNVLNCIVNVPAVTVTSPMFAGASAMVMDKFVADDENKLPTFNDALAALNVSEPFAATLPPKVTPKSVSVTDGFVIVRIEPRLIVPV